MGGEWWEASGGRRVVGGEWWEASACKPSEGSFQGARRMAPAVGFEPTTNRLTADRSTTELRWNIRQLPSAE